MKDLNNNVLSASISVTAVMNSHLANMSMFNIIGIEFDDQNCSSLFVATDHVDGRVSEGFLLEEDISGVYSYQSLCVDGRGNSHYSRAFDDGKGGYITFGSGWSSRVSVMNGYFNTSLVECYGSRFNGMALSFRTYLNIIFILYVGKVYIGVECEDNGEFNITICPFDESSMKKFDDSKTHAQHSIVLDTKYTNVFYDLAVGFISKASEGACARVCEIKDVQDFDYVELIHGEIAVPYVAEASVSVPPSDFNEFAELSNAWNDVLDVTAEEVAENPEKYQDDSDDEDQSGDEDGAIEDDVNFPF